MKYYCINNTFTHCLGSCDKVAPSNKWIFNEIPDEDSDDPVLYTDGLITISDRVPKRNDFGWMCESPELLSDLTEWIKENLSYVEDRFLKIFTPDRDLLGLSEVFAEAPGGSNMPWVKEWKMRSKSDLVSIIASNKRDMEGHKLRHQIIEGDPSIHAYGRGYKSIENKEEGLEKYMFSYCIENANVEFYYTEKITDAIACGTVPIYWGPSSISEVFDMRGIVVLEDLLQGKITLSEGLYNEMVPYLEDNLKVLHSIKTADDVIQETMKEEVTKCSR